MSLRSLDKIHLFGLSQMRALFAFQKQDVIESGNKREGFSSDTFWYKSRYRELKTQGNIKSSEQQNKKAGFMSAFESCIFGALLVLHLCPIKPQ